MEMNSADLDNWSHFSTRGAYLNNHFKEIIEEDRLVSLYDPDREDTTIYQVVMNHEEQYSIWPDYKDLPLGWQVVGKKGIKSECLAYIKEVWTDMRPLSLRKKMEEMAKNPPPLPPPSDHSSPREKSLVDRLCEGRHPVEASLRPERSAKALKGRIEMGYVHIRFTETKGGTELGVRVNPDTLELNQADFEKQVGQVHLEGDLTLDYVKVRCIANLDLGTLRGEGYLVRL
jgi:uncharacterized protein YbdZ (MbtH family)